MDRSTRNVEEVYDAASKKFVDFGVRRELGLFSDEEEKRFLEHWFAFWRRSFLAAGLGKRNFQQQFYRRVDLFADLLAVVAVLLIVQSTLTVRESLAAAVVGFYVAAAVFGVAHMALHATVLDYHWSASPTAFFHFAYLHHRTRHCHVFQGQLLIMLFPSTRQEGPMLYEFFKYGLLVVAAYAHRQTRLMVGWFLLSWILEAAAHQRAHHGCVVFPTKKNNSGGPRPSLPPVTRLLLEGVYAPLGLIPSAKSHRRHHDASHATRFTNFTDLRTPTLDRVLNAIWDRVYHDAYHRGAMYETLSISDSALVRWLNFLGFFLGWSFAKVAGGVDASRFFAWMCVFTHVLLVEPVRRWLV